MKRAFSSNVLLSCYTLVIVGMIGGCAKNDTSISVASSAVTTPVKNRQAATEEKSLDIAPNVDKADIPLKVASWEQTQEIIANHQGKVVVLDLWSNYCPPCIEELPNLVKLHQQHGGEVVCLSLNCNFSGVGSPEADREIILKILRETKATFQNLISSDADEVLYNKVGIASIPVIQVYDCSGKLSKQFDNEKNEYGNDGFTYAKHIMPFVENLLKETAK